MKHDQPPGKSSDAATRLPDCTNLREFRTGDIVSSPRPVSVAELAKAFPRRSEPVVDGLVRRGETMNIIASPKTGKTWLVHALARAVSRGESWLEHSTQKGRVLICDAELHPGELHERLRVSLGADMMSAAIDVLPLRGQGVDLNRLGEQLRGVGPGGYSLIVVDALYRFLPEGVSENDNSAMMRVYNSLDQIAARTQAAVAIVHHASKGDQSGKSVTDTGSGAGAISRAADSHLVIRPHQEEGLFVLQAVTRSFAQPADRSIRWRYPHWELVSDRPQLATRKTAAVERQQQLDAAAEAAIRDALAGSEKSVSELRGATGMGNDRIVRTLKRMGAIGRQVKSKRTGKVTERFRLP